MKRHRGLLIRIALYTAAAIALLLARNGVDWKRPGARHAPPDGARRTLTIAGDALAPGLARDVAAFYRRDYPGLEINFTGGGTNRAMEDVANRRADAAFLLRPPTDSEQHLIVTATGDSLLAFPVAIGGLEVIASAAGDTGAVPLDALRALAAGRPTADRRRLFAPDPNSGAWDAFRAVLGAGGGSDSLVTFLKDTRAVIEATASDPTALGIASSLDLPEDDRRIAVLPLRLSPGGPPVPPTRENIARSVYPLYHTLYVACLSAGGTEGARFVTHLTSARGQRQIERTATLPARREPRGVEITTGAPGERG